MIYHEKKQARDVAYGNVGWVFGWVFIGSCSNKFGSFKSNKNQQITTYGT